MRQFQNEFLQQNDTNLYSKPADTLEFQFETFDVSGK